MGKDSQILKVKETYGEVYTKKQLKSKYYIESEAYGGILCTNKKDESMTVFTKINIEGKEYYCKVGI